MTIRELIQIKQVNIFSFTCFDEYEAFINEEISMFLDIDDSESYVHYYEQVKNPSAKSTNLYKKIKSLRTEARHFWRECYDHTVLCLRKDCKRLAEIDAEGGLQSDLLHSYLRACIWERSERIAGYQHMAQEANIHKNECFERYIKLSNIN